MQADGFDCAVHEMITRLQADGIPMQGGAILDAVARPHGEEGCRERDWRRYVPEGLRRDWHALPLEARLCAFEVAELVALDEPVGAPMLTGDAG